MAKSRSTPKKTTKPAVKVQDLSAKDDPKGGRKAGKGQQEFLVIKMNDIIVT